MTSFAQEAEQRMAEGKKKWIARMKKENPEHAKYFCPEHGNYVGSNNLFECVDCSD